MLFITNFPIRILIWALILHLLSYQLLSLLFSSYTISCNLLCYLTNQTISPSFHHSLSWITLLSSSLHSSKEAFSRFLSMVFRRWLIGCMETSQLIHQSIHYLLFLQRGMFIVVTIILLSRCPSQPNQCRWSLCWRFSQEDSMVLFSSMIDLSMFD